MVRKRGVMVSMYRAYKYRIYPDEEQKIMLSKTFGCCRFVYNHYLGLRIEAYKNDQTSLSKIECNNHLNRELKQEKEWLREVDKFALTNSIYDLDAAYQNFFRRVQKGDTPGFPRFKAKHENDHSYTTNFTNGNIKVLFDENLIKVPKISVMKASVHRKFDGQVKSATVSKTPSGKYYVSVLVETVQSELPEATGRIGIDVGLTDYAVTSEGKKHENPGILAKYEKRQTRLQRRLSRKQKGSSNKNKQREKLARIHEKISNVRVDALHKLSRMIVNENQVIVSEDLNVSGMIKNRNLAKAISDVSWSEFMRQLTYKSGWYGRTYHKIDRFYPSSKLCSTDGCGYKHADLTLSVREWVCPECETLHDRDINAAKNILNKGLKDLGIA
jgi:putative transposase